VTWRRALGASLILLGVVLYALHRGHPTSPPKATVASTAVPACISAHAAWGKIGQSVCVQFRVGYTYVSSSGNAYLDQYENYSTGFGVWIPAGYSFGSNAVSEYAGRTIQVTGVVTSYEGAPQIEVSSQSQITAP